MTSPSPSPLPPPRPELCVGAVIIDADRLLLIRRGRPPGAGRWSLPGGRVEHAEALTEAVVREVAEETGLEAVCGELIGWVERIGRGYHFVILDFAATVADPRGLRPGDDADDAAWVPRDGVGGLELVDGLADFLVDHGVIEPAVAAPEGIGVRSDPSVGVGRSRSGPPATERAGGIGL